MRAAAGAWYRLRPTTKSESADALFATSAVKPSTAGFWRGHVELFSSRITRCDVLASSSTNRLSLSEVSA
jgi:hypothetical protein